MGFHFGQHSQARKVMGGAGHLKLRGFAVLAVGFERPVVQSAVCGTASVLS